MSSPTIVAVNRRALAQFLSDNTLLQAAENTAAALKGSRTIEALLHRLLNSVFEQIPATRAAVLKPGAKAGEFDPLAFREAPFPTDNALVAQAVDDSSGILLTHKKSVLCVPIGTQAAIYLETPTPEAFTLQHLQLLIVIAAEATLPLDFAIHLDTVTAEHQDLRAWVHADHGLIGESAAILKLQTLINKVAASDTTILILGEMGTGKEVVARAIHNSRFGENRRPFVAVNCAAIPEDLIESELFGHERGAFSGAVVLKKGKVEIAHGGTLFLDEVGELSPKLQAALLRFLQEREYQRVGGTQTLHADVRIVAATNRNLEEMVAQGLFRADLYYRLAVITLRTPSLREMREDIPRLAEHFVKQRSYLRVEGVVKGISSAAQELLAQYAWPGNVRHLQNVIERALVLGESEFIEPEDLTEIIFSGTQVHASAHGYHARVTAFKKEILREALRKTGGDFVKAALLLEISASFLRRQCRDFGIE